MISFSDELKFLSQVNKANLLWIGKDLIELLMLFIQEHIELKIWMGLLFSALKILKIFKNIINKNIPMSLFLYIVFQFVKIQSPDW